MKYNYLDSIALDILTTIRILDFAWSPLQSLSTPFLLIFGQEFLKTRPCLDFGGVPRFTEHTSQTGPMTGQTGRTGQIAAMAGQTGRLVVGLLLLVLPPRVLNSSTNLQGPSLLELPDEISKAQTSLHQ